MVEMHNSPDKADRSIRRTLSSWFPITPKPLVPPTLDNQFDALTVVERITESLGYNILCFEYFLSPKGGLRQWLKINMSLFVLFAIPIFLFVPLATYFMGGFQSITEMFANATKAMLLGTMNLGAAIVTIILTAFLLYGVFKIVAWRVRTGGGAVKGNEDTAKLENPRDTTITG